VVIVPVDICVLVSPDSRVFLSMAEANVNF
jgi:hypothetical protein